MLTTYESEVTYTTASQNDKEPLSKVASEALRQVCSLLHKHGEDLASSLGLIEHTSLGSYLCLPAAIATVYRP